MLGERGGFSRVPPRNDDLDAVLQKQPRKPPAEHAIAAEDQHFHEKNLRGNFIVGQMGALTCLSALTGDYQMLFMAACGQ